jgi:hypothetical protein
MLDVAKDNIKMSQQALEHQLKEEMANIRDANVDA